MSHRFGKGMCLNGGPLAYRSTQPPKPLTLEEEALLAFAACGVTGYALAELPYQTGDRPEAGSGNIMTHFIGRTVPSGDAMHDSQSSSSTTREPGCSAVPKTSRP